MIIAVAVPNVAWPGWPGAATATALPVTMAATATVSSPNTSSC